MAGAMLGLTAPMVASRCWQGEGRYSVDILGMKLLLDHREALQVAEQLREQGVVIPGPSEEGDLRVCPQCEAERLAKQSKTGSLQYHNCAGEIAFRCAGNVEVLRVCAHRMWVNPTVKTNEAAKEFISFFGG